MKYVLVIATGVLFGEIIQEMAKITQSIPFKENKSILGTEFHDYLAEHDQEFRKVLPDNSEEIISDNAVIIEYLRSNGYDNSRFASPGERPR